MPSARRSALLALSISSALGLIAAPVAAIDDPCPSFGPGLRWEFCDLVNLDLDGIDLSGSDMTEVDLHHSRLNGANFSGSTLDRSDLAMTQLRGANLSDTALTDTFLNDADLRGANLTGARWDAVLSGADLRGADLSDATIDPTYLADANFTHANLSGTTFAEPDIGSRLTAALTIDHWPDDTVFRVGDATWMATPSGQPDSASTIGGIAVAIDVLANDTDPNVSADAPHTLTDGRIFTAVVTKQPARATVATDVAGRLVVTPDRAFQGELTFTYKPTASLPGHYELPAGAATSISGAPVTVTVAVGDGFVSPITGEWVGRTGVEGSLTRLYAAYFGRNPDAGGFDYWIDEVTAGDADLLETSLLFSQSEEFQLRYGSLTNSQFLSLIYINVFGRDIDADGRAYWTAQMDAGLGQHEVVFYLADGREFRNATQTD